MDQSLKRLGTDWIDVYLAAPGRPIQALGGHAGGPRRGGAVGQGPLHRVLELVGLEGRGALEIQKSGGLAPFTHGQLHYSLLGRDVERDVVPMMRRYGLGMTVWSPLATGFLSGKYTRETLSDPDNRYAGFDILPFDKDHGFTVVERLRAVADRHDVSVAQTALAWLLAKPSVTSVLVGASKRSQLDDNLGAADIQLAAEDVAELDAATPLSPVYPNWYIDNLTDQPVAAALDGGH